MRRLSDGSSSSQQPIGPSDQEEDDEQHEEEVEAEGEDQTDDEFWFRGPTRVPTRPAREEDKTILSPQGDRHWMETDFGENGRVPNGILTTLIKRWFPGLVEFKGRKEPAWTWKHYKLVKDNTREQKKRLPTVLHRVEQDFWLYFRWAEGKEEEARKVVHACVKHLIPNIFYEARILAVINYHRKHLKKNITRGEACRTYLSKEEYMLVRPWWFQASPEAWEKLIDFRWCNEEWKAKSCIGRERKAKMTQPAHRQGSASMTRYQKNMEKTNKKPVSHLEAYAHSRREDREGSFLHLRGTQNVEAYAAVCIKLHGPNYDWRNSPLDGLAVYLAGGGKKHGRFLLGDGLINTSTVLADVRAMSTELEDDPRPRRRQRQNPENSCRFEELQRELQLEREERQREREEREEEKKREREEREEEKKREREEREQERVAWEQKSNYFTSVLQVLQSKMNIDLPPCPPPANVVVLHQSTSGSAASNESPSPDNQMEASEPASTAHDVAGGGLVVASNN